MTDNDLMCLSHWFPIVEASRVVQVPRTLWKRFKFGRPAWDALFDGKPADDSLKDLYRWIDEAAEQVGGYPVFLRTGQTSAKHSWKDSCHLQTKVDIAQHVHNIVEFSECADMMGLPWDVWAVREMLPTEPIFHAFYGWMPIVREFRFFTKGGKVQCWHPYWPEAVFIEHAISPGKHPVPPPDWKQKLASISTFKDLPYEATLTGWSEQIASLDGLREHDWSIDWLHTNDSWFMTDMALAHRSWHHPDCEFAKGTSKTDKE